VAISFLAEPRTTRDVDLAVVAASESQADEIIRGMHSAGFVVRELFQRNTGALATARLTFGNWPTRLDLLFGTSGLERSVVANAVELEIVPGVFSRVTRRPHLIAMKVVAARPRDLLDIHSLLDAGTREEQGAVEPILSELPPERRSKAVLLWKRLLRERAKPVADLIPAPARLKRLLKKPRR
jgi:hypothetical protein